MDKLPDRSQRRTWRLIATGLLLISTLILVMGWLPWQQLQQKLERHQDTLLHQLSLTVEMLAQQGRVTADTLSSDLQRDPEIISLLALASLSDDETRDEARRQLQQRLTPLYQDMQALYVRQFQFHDAAGNSVLRMHQPDFYGDSLLNRRPALVRVMREQQPVSVYETGRFHGGYRNIYPLFSDDRQYLGSMEIGFSPALLIPRIQTSFTGARFYFLSTTAGQDSPDQLKNFVALPGIERFALDQAASSPDVQPLQQFAHQYGPLLQQRLNNLLPGLIRIEDQDLLILPVQNLAGRYSAAILVLMPDTYVGQLWRGFYDQLIIGLIIVTLLVAGLVWVYFQRREVSSAFQQLSLALQGGQLYPWDYYPCYELSSSSRGKGIPDNSRPGQTGSPVIHGRLVFGGLTPSDIRHWHQQRNMTVENWLLTLHPDDQPRVRMLLERQSGRQGEALELEFRTLRDSNWRWISARGKAVSVNSHGDVERYSGVYRDITAEKQMQLALEQSEQKYRALFASNKAVELIIDPDSRQIVDANQAAVEYYRYPRQTLLGMKMDRINTLSAAEIGAEMVRAVAENRSHFLFQHQLADGRVRDVEVYSGPIIMADGHRYLYSIVHDITSRKQAEQALHDSKNRIDSLFRVSIDGILMVDSRGRIEYWNDAAAEVLGGSTELVRGQSLDWQLLQQEDLQWLRWLRRQAIRGQRISKQGRLREFCINRESDEYCWLEVAVSSFRQADCWHFVAVIRDITGRKQQEMALHQASIAFENTMEGIVITDTQNRIISVNRAVETISGYSRDELIGKPPSTFSSGVHGQRFYQQMWQTLQETGHWQGEISNRHKEGRIYSEWLNINEVKDEQGEVCNYVAVFSDITDLKASRERLDYLAHHDVLTGLPNRLVFRERLEQGILRARRSGDPVAVLFIDLDRFKHINDNLGHDVGDELLQSIARILQEEVRDSDTVVRLGGDEFSILMEGFVDQEALARRTGRLIDCLSRPIRVPSGHALKVGASIGIAVYPQDAQDASALVKHADIAMYRAKELGKGRYEFYNQQMTDAARLRFSIEAALDDALSVDDQIQVYYQPQIDLKTRAVCGLEALVRWEHPERGLVGPDQFIPLAEENGMIHRLGRRVAEIALRDLARLRQQQLFSGMMAINISTLELERPEFSDQMLELCRRNDLVQFVELEVTETSLGHHPEQFFNHLRRLRACGFKVAIDDFGTGHSTLVRLKQCPSDYLKIDRTFVQQLPHDLDDLVITRTILSLGQSLGQKVIAEGIETAEQAALLSHLGCDIGQGYFFSRPLSLVQLETFLQDVSEPEELAALGDWL